ncbi:MAG: lactate utilization protein [Bacteroidales bacterium]|nr:lactate utilization protein [Bacteroidales bacterium]
MKEITSREKILNRIRNASMTKSEPPSANIDFDKPVYVNSTESADITFAQEFSRLKGKFIYCENEKELSANLSGLITERKWDSVSCPDPEFRKWFEALGITIEESPDKSFNCGAVITGCEYLIARTGSILISSAQDKGRQHFITPDTHIVVGYISQVVNDIKDGLARMKERYGNDMPSMISLVSGPSRTADIEKTLVMGAHGPKELFVFLTED